MERKKGEGERELDREGGRKRGKEGEEKREGEREIERKDENICVMPGIPVNKPFGSVA